MILIDSPDEGYCENKGWVAATVAEDVARDRLAEFCFDEEGEMGYRPTGPAKIVRLACANPDEDEEYQRWVPDEAGAEFWEVIVG